MAYNKYETGRAENVANQATGINTSEFYDRNLLETAREKFIVSNFTSKKTIPKYEGNGVIFSYYEPIPKFDTPLAEGIAPIGSALSKVNIRANMGNYGTFVPFTDDLDIYGEDGARFKSDVTSNLGGAAGETQESLIFAAIEASSTTIAFNTTAGQTVRDAELTLRKALGEKFTTMVTGSTNYGTSPVRAAYVGLVSVDGAVLIESESEYLSVENYGYSDGLLPNEVGTYKGVRVCESTLVEQNGAGHERMFVLAEESVFETGIRGMKKIETIIKDLGEVGEDQLNQNGSVGSKFRLAVATRPEWCCDCDLEAV